LLYVMKSPLSGMFGYTSGIGPGPPRTALGVLINVETCNQPNGPGVGAILAHELAHGCNVFHHGPDELDYGGFTPQWYKNSTNEWLDLPTGGKLSLPIAGPHGPASGTDGCFMRITHFAYWGYENTTGYFRWRKMDGVRWIRGLMYNSNEDKPARFFCSDDQGTGVNSPRHPFGPVAGDATEGYCRVQFQVNDLKAAKRR